MKNAVRIKTVNGVKYLFLVAGDLYHVFDMRGNYYGDYIARATFERALVSGVTPFKFEDISGIVVNHK